MRAAVEPSSPMQQMWKPELYKIQLEAPTPKPLHCTRSLPMPSSGMETSSSASSQPSTVDQHCYGKEYHGLMGHHEAEQLLANTIDGTYLLRRSPNALDYATLSVRFNKRTKHFKIYYNPEKGHYLQDESKSYNTVHEMVADGLITFYVQLHAALIIQQINQQTKNSYRQSPYMTLNRRKLRSLSDKLRKSAAATNLSSLADSSSTPAALTSNDVGDAKITIMTPSSVPAASVILINATESSAEPATVRDINNTQNSDDADGNRNDALVTSANTTTSSTESDPIVPLVYEKPHNFKVHTFKGLNWCELCANFLWGFTAQGVKCEACGFVAHSKCSELVPPKCVPDLKRIRGVFGADLTTMVQLYQCSIPFVVRRCVEEVEARGMLQEGIYRVSGFADEIDALKLALDRYGEKTDMSETAYGNVNVIAGTLKLYLRLLPVPLITFQAYPSFMAAARNVGLNEQLQQMADAAHKLPLAHFNCLKYMLEHLKRVASHYAANKMNEHNLATVFAPTLIATPQHMTNLIEEIFMLSLLIAYCNIIFA